MIMSQTGKSVMSSTPLPLPNTSQSLSSLSSESLLHSDDKSPQSESLSPSPRANLEYAMLIRTRKATCGWIKPVAEGGCFGVLNGSPNWEKRREVFLVFTGSESFRRLFTSGI
jgi:hypothetical protein